MTRPLRIAQVAPVATCVPPSGSGSVETATSLLTEGLVRHGHEVTLFATGDSTTTARLRASFPKGYNDDTSIWPWELCELFNLAAAIERGGDFDIIHYQCEYYPMSLAFSRLARTPVVQTVHHAPHAVEVALWATYPEAPFIAVSNTQAQMMAGLNIVATIHHAIDVESFPFSAQASDYVVFLGRFTEGKGVVEAIEVAKRTGMRLVLAARENEYYAEAVAPLVDGVQIVYAGEVGPEDRARLLGGARALIYPVQQPEPFGLVLPESMACGTPVAALGIGAVPELVDDGVTGGIFSSLDDMVAGLARVCALDRRRVRQSAERRFGIDRMIDEHVSAYRRVLERAGRAQGRH